MLAFTLVIVFIASSGLVVGGYVFMTRRRLAREEAARRRLSEPVTFSDDVRLLRHETVSAIPMLDDLLRKAPGTLSLSQAIHAAGMKASPATLVLTGGVLGAVGFYIGQAQRSLLLSVPLAALGLAAPYLYLKWKRRRRIAKFESQLPDAIDMVTNAMRAGYAFQGAMELVGQEIADPLGAEFAQFYEEQNLGMDVRTALLALQSRVPSLDLKMFITAVLIQRETGGNLSEVLENIATVIRGRFRIQGELKTLTAQVRLSSKILGLLPVIVVGLITIMNPSFMAPLFNETVGRILLASAAVSQIIGFIAMWRLADIEI
jgi:tight adherence protein B